MTNFQSPFSLNSLFRLRTFLHPTFLSMVKQGMSHVELFSGRMLTQLHTRFRGLILSYDISYLKYIILANLSPFPLGNEIPMEVVVIDRPIY